jgi:hypothetical protein
MTKLEEAFMLEKCMHLDFKTLSKIYISVSPTAPTLCHVRRQSTVSPVVMLSSLHQPGMVAALPPGTQHYVPPCFRPMPHALTC